LLCVLGKIIGDSPRISLRVYNERKIQI
jgi:hypothetical protein